jgi:hypothetical protein
MASSILSALWPEEFTVYDSRGYDELGSFRTLKNLGPQRVWPGYCQYRNAVHHAVRSSLVLRDKDRHL